MIIDYRIHYPPSTPGNLPEENRYFVSQRMPRNLFRFYSSLCVTQPAKIFRFENVHIYDLIVLCGPRDQINPRVIR